MAMKVMEDLARRMGRRNDCMSPRIVTSKSCIVYGTSDIPQPENMAVKAQACR
jgi:hypothetical protein